MEATFSKYQLEDFGRSVAREFLDDGADLNDSITKLAKENGFTNHHISRVVENANIYVNGALVKQARADGNDPRVRFERADFNQISRLMHGDHVKEASLRKAAEVDDLFRMPAQSVDSGQVLDGTIGSWAPDPYASGRRNIDHMELAGEYVKNVESVEKIASRVDAQSIGLALQTIETMEAEARRQHSLDKQAMDSAEIEIRNEINDQILSGVSPATIRGVFQNSNLDQSLIQTMDGLVTKVASELRAREGENKFDNKSLVNANHPLLKSASGVMDLVKKAAKSGAGLKKLSTAVEKAKEHYAQAVREGI